MEAHVWCPTSNKHCTATVNSSQLFAIIFWHKLISPASWFNPFWSFAQIDETFLIKRSSSIWATKGAVSGVVLSESSLDLNILACACNTPPPRGRNLVPKTYNKYLRNQRRIWRYPKVLFFRAVKWIDIYYMSIPLGSMLLSACCCWRSNTDKQTTIETLNARVETAKAITNTTIFSIWQLHSHCIRILFAPVTRQLSTFHC